MYGVPADRDNRSSKGFADPQAAYLLEVLKSGDTPNTSLLEIGCGSGRIIASIREQKHIWRLTGLDRSREQLKIAHRAHHPFLDETLDHVAIMDFLEHIPNSTYAISEVLRVLKLLPRDSHTHISNVAEGIQVSFQRGDVWAHSKVHNS